MIEGGGKIKRDRVQMFSIDRYRSVYDNIAITITTRINGSDLFYLFEPYEQNTQNYVKIMNEDKKTKVAMTLDGTATTLTTAHHYSGNIVNPKRGQTEMGVRENFRIRKLTPRECFRLMDVSDKDIDTIQAAGVSDSQQYKLAGNSIVVNVLTEIFRKLLVDTQNDDRQLRMF